MRILVSNDDGIHAPGLAVLERIARTLSDDVWVVAPESDQSGLSHSLSLSDPLRLREISDRHFAVSGTPGDCVIMALRKLMPEAPDLVLSGINAGQNAADDVTYSGTVAAAMEGTLMGINSIALSQAYDFHGDGNIPWETGEHHAPALIRELISFGFADNVLYNLNFPNCAPADVVGTRVTAQGRQTHGLQVDERLDGRGHRYYWLAYRRRDEATQPGTDLEAIAGKAISVTPLRLDLTARDIGETLGPHLARNDPAR